MTHKKNNRKAVRVVEKPALRSKVLVRGDMIGGGKIQLLRAIAETGSISSAAKTMGLGYRRAWFLIETMQRIFDEPVLISERGGSGAGTRLTPFGAELVHRYQGFEQHINAAAGDFLGWLEDHQNHAPLPAPSDDKP